jgi:Undecaprenyl-phosphate galactose phosphotransferase WbaP
MSTLHAAPEASVYSPVDLATQSPRDPIYSAMLILATDVMGLSLTLWAFLRCIAIERSGSSAGFPSWVLLLLFVATLWLFGAYPGVSVHPVEEIKRISLANLSAYLFVFVFLALRHARAASLAICLLACVASSIAAIWMRVLARHIGSRFAWWGYPVVMFGTSTAGFSLLQILKSQPHLGMRPVAVIGDRQSDGIPACTLEDLRPIARSGVRHAILAAQGLPALEFNRTMDRLTSEFPNVILIPDNHFLWKTGAQIRDVMGVPGLMVRNNLLDRRCQMIKRVLDLSLTSLLLICLLPGMVLIAIMIVAESGFPVFYLQNRLGRHGRSFSMYKFRTMRPNAAEILKQHLSKDLKLQKEWAEKFKLRQDPRVTRVGKVLRQASLDELPQLWNVLRGDMSIVGPRPIVTAEIALYREAYSLYSKTLPGLTGLWQVSGRSRTTYAERVAYDSFYVRNWSVWMDIYLLGRTIAAVLSGDGAY